MILLLIPCQSYNSAGWSSKRSMAICATMSQIFIASRFCSSSIFLSLASLIWSYFELWRSSKVKWPHLVTLNRCCTLLACKSSSWHVLTHAQTINHSEPPRSISYHFIIIDISSKGNQRCGCRLSRGITMQHFAKEASDNRVSDFEVFLVKLHVLSTCIFQELTMTA